MNEKCNNNFEATRAYIKQELAKITTDLPLDFQVGIMNDLYDYMNKQGYTDQRAKILIDRVILGVNTAV